MVRTEGVSTAWILICHFCGNRHPVPSNSLSKRKKKSPYPMHHSTDEKLEEMLITASKKHLSQKKRPINSS